MYPEAGLRARNLWPSASFVRGVALAAIFFHPKPEAGEDIESPGPLNFGISGTLAAWTLQQLVTAAVYRALCLRTVSALTGTSMTWSHPVLQPLGRRSQ